MGISKESKKWVYGGYFRINNRAFIVDGESLESCCGRYCECEGPCLEVPDFTEVFPESVGQFIGCIDIIGTNIFEGDYVFVGVCDIAGEFSDGKDYICHWGGNEYPAFTLKGYESEANAFSEIIVSGDYKMRVHGSIHDHVFANGN